MPLCQEKMLFLRKIFILCKFSIGNKDWLRLIIVHMDICYIFSFHWHSFLLHYSALRKKTGKSSILHVF